MSKNIAIFIDGTWNSYDKKGETNVHKLFEAARACSEQPERWEGDVPIAGSEATQIVHYLKGVGTGGLIDRYFGGATGFGTEKRIKEAYLFLALNYKPGDNLYLFGFSRGAFAARSLAAFIGVVGPTLKSRASWEKVAKAYIRYVQADDMERFLGAMQNEGVDEVQEVQSIPIRFIGVWDTVKRLGLTPLAKPLWTKHHDYPKLPEHIIDARHALALHDLRPEFEPTLWEDWDAGTTLFRPSPQSLQQVWFPGAHSDVGGGYVETGISDITLHWMARESRIKGLKLDCNLLPELQGVSPSTFIHSEKEIIRSHGPRQILSDWNFPPKARLIKSFFMHEVACNQLFNKPPREYWIVCSRTSKSTPPMEVLVSGKDYPLYSDLLTKVDQLTLSLHLALSFKQDKRFIQ